MVRSADLPCARLLAALLFVCSTTFAATYYVRTDGGTAAQCTGLANAAYSGSGTAQACAWDHPFQALPPDGTPRISGGDTLIIGSGSYQMGYGASGADACESGGSWECYMPPIPSGTDSSHRTRILGQGSDTGCSSPPQLWGTERAEMVINLTDSSHVEVGCLEITDHSGCVVSHSGSVACERDTSPFGTWGDAGIYAEDSTDVLLKNLNVHGLASTGIHAGRLTDWTIDTVTIRANGWVGWDGDLQSDSGTDSNSGTMKFTKLRVEWNGCAETYPGKQPSDCWGQEAGGYGDGFGTGSTGGKWIVEDSAFIRNTSDGLDLLYCQSTCSIEIRRTLAEGNAGNQIKTSGPVKIENSIIVGNCGFFYQNAADYWVDDCRALGTALAMDLFPGNAATVFNTTIASEGDCVIVADCAQGSTCTGAETVTVRNALLVGYIDFLQPFESSALAYQESWTTNPFSIDYSLITGVKDNECPTGTNVCGGTPGITSATLDSFDARLAAGSAAIDVGTATGAPTTDYTGATRDSKPDIGAYEYAGSSQPPTTAKRRRLVGRH